MQIDFVIPWVDGGDPVWRAEKAKYAPKTDGDAREIRFRDWENLQYCFRSIEKFAPWVNRVHFITWGHLPSWMNTDNPKLNIVRHEDYIPPQYLPTFSSHPIELNLHRIEGLAEHFVYFNDDIFLINNVSEEDFFRQGLPCDHVGFGVPHAKSLNGVFAHTCLNNIALVNCHLKKRTLQKKALFRWLHPRNGKKNIFQTLALLSWPYFVGFNHHHLAIAYEKRTFEEVWAAEPVGLDATCHQRFRSMADVSQLAMRSWRLAKGEFTPAHSLGRAFFFNGGNTIHAASAIRNQVCKMICLNDDAGNFDFEAEKARLIEAFETILPKKCSFEK